MIISGFFGYQNENYRFQLYGLSHLLPILIMILLLFLLFVSSHKIKHWKYETVFRYYLGTFMILNQMAYSYNNIYITSLLYNDGLTQHYPFPYASITKDLPLSLCGISMILTGLLLFTKSKKLFDILYFWVLCGATLALLLPSAIANNTYGHFGPDKFRFYQFFIGHIGIVFIIFYMIFVWRYNINIKSLYRSFIWLIIFGFITLLINKGIGANYLFLISPIDTGLNIFPKYPYNLLIYFIISAFFFFIAYLPWFYRNKKQFK